MASADPPTVGQVLRRWRRRRRFSQLQLAEAAEVSTRHLSCVETGKSSASRELLLHLARTLEMPLHAQNTLLLAGGLAPQYADQGLADLPAAQHAIEHVLDAHLPFPGLAIDAEFDVVAANQTATSLMSGIAPSLFNGDGTVNLMRASLHPDGLSVITTNFDEWAPQLVDQLERAVEFGIAPGLHDLLDEVRSYPTVRALHDRRLVPLTSPAMVATVRLATPHGELAMFTVMASFGTPLAVGLDGLRVELFFPADDATADRLRAGFRGQGPRG